MNGRVYALFGQLLDYPSSVLPGAVAELIALLDNYPEAIAGLIVFQRNVQSQGLAELQECYIRTFDFRADCSLYLGHHLFGESGRRGVFMAELTDRYREKQLAEREDLPDHLSCVLRYLAVLDPGEEASELVHACLIPAISRINAVKAVAISPYRSVLEVLPRLLDNGENGPHLPGELAWIPSYSSHFPILP